MTWLLCAPLPLVATRLQSRPPFLKFPTGSTCVATCTVSCSVPQFQLRSLASRRLHRHYLHSPMLWTFLFFVLAYNFLYSVACRAFPCMLCNGLYRSTLLQFRTVPPSGPFSALAHASACMAPGLLSPVSHPCMNLCTLISHIPPQESIAGVESKLNKYMEMLQSLERKYELDSLVDNPTLNAIIIGKLGQTNNSSWRLYDSVGQCDGVWRCVCRVSLSVFVWVSARLYLCVCGSGETKRVKQAGKVERRKRGQVVLKGARNERKTDGREKGRVCLLG